MRNWFDKFRSGDFSLKDEQRSGRLNEVNDDQIKAINQIGSSRISARDLRNVKNTKLTTNHHIQHLGLVKKLDISIPHELKEIHLR